MRSAGRPNEFGIGQKQLSEALKSVRAKPATFFFRPKKLRF